MLFQLLQLQSSIWVILSLYGIVKAQSAKAIDWDPTVTPYPAALRANVTFEFQSASAKGNVTVLDPYNWFKRLANSSSDQTIKSFNDQQDQLTQSYLNKSNEDYIKSLDSIQLAGNYSSLSPPLAFGPIDKLVYVYGLNQPGKSQGIYYLATQAELEKASTTGFNPLPGKPLLDEIILGPGMETSYLTLSPDCSKFSFTSYNQTDDNAPTISYIRNISSPLLTLEDIPNHYSETFDDIKGGGIIWYNDSESIFYETEKEIKNGTVQVSLFYHKLGKDIKDDILVIKPITDHIGGYIHFISYDLKFLIVYTWTKDKKYRSVYTTSLEDESISSNMKWICIQKNSRNDLDELTNIGTDFYFMTDIGDGTRVEQSIYKVIRISINMEEAIESSDLENVLQQKSGKIETIIPVPENENPILWIDFCVFDNDKVLIPFKRNANTDYIVFNLTTGEKIQQILTDLISVDYILCCTDFDKNLFIETSSFNFPNQIFKFKWDSKTQNLPSPFLMFESKFSKDFINSNDFKLEQKNVTGKDGVQIPIMLMYRNGLNFDGSNPAIVTFPSAYGDTMYPLYDPFYMSFVHDYDGVFVVIGPRGSRQVGEPSWHTDGMLRKKQNTFDDVLSSIQFLIDQKLTSAGKIILNVELASAMAALVIANQAPEGLIGAIIAKRGFYDMLHIEDSTDAEKRIAEFGDPKDPKAFDWLDAYSPLQNVKSGKLYPTIIFVQGTDDDYESELWHSEKMIAELQFKLSNNSFPFFLGNFQDDKDDISEAKALAIVVHSLGLQRVH